MHGLLGSYVLLQLEKSGLLDEVYQILDHKDDLQLVAGAVMYGLDPQARERIPHSQSHIGHCTRTDSMRPQELVRAVVVRGVVRSAVRNMVQALDGRGKHKEQPEEEPLPLLESVLVWHGQQQPGLLNSVLQLSVFPEGFSEEGAQEVMGSTCQLEARLRLQVRRINGIVRVHH
jgi:hypothetical protein